MGNQVDEGTFWEIYAHLFMLLFGNQHIMESSNNLLIIFAVYYQSPKTNVKMFKFDTILA